MDATAQPDWVEWADTPRAEDWKAVALSLGIDPHGMRHHPQSWMAGGVGGPYFRPETFPTDAVKQEFERRLRIVRANAGAGGAIEGNALANGGYIVNLRSFLAWAWTRWSVPHEWAAAIGHVMRLPEADTRLIRNLAAEERKTAAPAGQAATGTRPPQQQRHQEQEILRVLDQLGYTPAALPKSPPGTKGPKAAARQELKYSTGVFNKAWERLRASGGIRDAE